MILKFVTRDGSETSTVWVEDVNYVNVTNKDYTDFYEIRYFTDHSATATNVVNALLMDVRGDQKQYWAIKGE